MGDCCRRRREEGGAGANMRLMRVKYCSLNIESSHNFVIEYIHISLFYKHKLSFKFMFYISRVSLFLQ
jgi:hypothetical protein